MQTLKLVQKSKTKAQQKTLIRLLNPRSKMCSLSSKISELNWLPSASEETQELKSKMADLHGRILDLENEIRKVNQTAAKILKGQSQMKQKIGANHDEVKKEFANLSKDVKSQMTSPVSRNSTVQSNFDAPKLTPKPTSSALTAPQFYTLEQFRGSSFTPPSSAWKTKCLDLPLEFSGFTLSLKTGGHCLFVCPEKNCQPESFGFSKTGCQRINPSTKEMGKLNGLKKIKSFRQC